MIDEIATPWFDSTLQCLGLRKGERALALEPLRRNVVALRAAIGDEGELTVVVGDPAAAEGLAAMQAPQLRVIAHDAVGGERFGTFDAAMFAPHTGPLLPAEVYAELARKNLRPGGRFVVDVPAKDMLPDLSAAWSDSGWDEERLSAITGPSDAELVDALGAAGLRAIAGSPCTHILQASSAAEFVAAFAGDLGLTDDDVIELGHAIVRNRQEPGPLELLVHRAQATGRR